VDIGLEAFNSPSARKSFQFLTILIMKIPHGLNSFSDGAEQSKRTELALYDLLNGGFSFNSADDTLFDADPIVEAF
jgi:hypothetical protein